MVLLLCEFSYASADQMAEQNSYYKSGIEMVSHQYECFHEHQEYICKHIVVYDVVIIIVSGAMGRSFFKAFLHS